MFHVVPHFGFAFQVLIGLFVFFKGGNRGDEAPGKKSLRED